MAEFILSNKVFDKLLMQLVTIEEGKENMSGYLGDDKNLSQLASMMTLYESKLIELVESAVKREEDDASVPFVVIGGEPTVYDLDSGETITYRITTPETFETEGNDVTLLSPIGKALFLREVGDKVDISVPAGTIHYEIKSIELNTEIDVESMFTYFKR